jgi:triacylglycerol lipase
MLPIFLLLWLIAELATYYLLARWLGGLEQHAAVLAAILTLLLARALQNAGLWLLSRRHTSSRTRPGFSVIVGEYLAFIRTFLLVLPGERLWMPADRLNPASRVVVLVHGYGCSRGVWYRMRHRLESAGCTVATVSLFPPFISMGRMVPLLQARIEAVCRQTGARKVTLIGHSMGGLICRSYLARHGHEERVAALITLATPNAGTELARYGIGQNAREMQPQSLWLRDMAVEKPGVPAIALCNPCDNYVFPQENQRLPGAHNVDLPPIGHLAMLYDRRVSDLVVDACTVPGKRS